MLAALPCRRWENSRECGAATLSGRSIKIKFMPEVLLMLRAHKIVHFSSDVSESPKLDVESAFNEQYFPLLPAR